MLYSFLSDRLSLYGEKIIERIKSAAKELTNECEIKVEPTHHK